MGVSEPTWAPLSSGSLLDLFYFQPHVSTDTPTPHQPHITAPRDLIGHAPPPKGAL